MRAQLSHLADLAGHCGHVTIRLLPLTAGLPPAGGAGGFSVLRFCPVPAIGLVHVTGPDGGLCPASPHAVAGYLRTLTHLQAVALSPEHTTRRLQELAGSDAQAAAKEEDR